MPAPTLFAPAENTSAYLKAGFLGFAGAGKTKTASLLAIGLILHLRKLGIDYANKPAFFLDSETGSDWVKPDFDEAGIPLMVAKTRAFADLCAAVPEAQLNGSILIVDSLTHFWKELCETYAKRKAAQFKRQSYSLQFQDWSYLKGDEHGWGKFTNMFINSPLHIIVCGRAGYEYDFTEDEEGKKQLEKTGVKMKAESEMGFEPSLLVLMERKMDLKEKETWREATILKDRSTLLDGKQFINPKFENFLPHIQRLNLGGRQLGVDTSRTSQHTISTDKKDWHPVQRKIVLDEIETLLVEHYPGTSKEEKQAKIALIRKHFGEEMSWARLEELVGLEDLRRGYDSLFRDLKNKPSQYAPLFEERNTTTDIDDELPDFLSAPKTAPEATIRDKLIGDIANLNTMADCLSWATDVAARTDLTIEDRNAISTVLLKRQLEISKAPAAEPKGQGTEPAEEPQAASRPADGKKASKAGRLSPAEALAAG